MLVHDLSQRIAAIFKALSMPVSLRVYPICDRPAV